MTLTCDELITQLHDQCHATVPFPIRRTEFQDAINQFLAFLALPLEVKESIYFKINPDDRGSEVGYRKYLRNEGQTDNREYVHYHQKAEEAFQVIRKTVPEFDALLHAMKRIYDQASLTLEEALQTLERRFPGMYTAYFPEDGQHHFYLRFLKYDRAAPGEFLAKGHYDRGGVTLALAESAPGLRMGLDDAHLQEVAHEDGYALLMPGLLFPNVTAGTIPATWHDVIQKGEDAYSNDIARWAIVFFADAQKMTGITYEQAHTPKRA